mmetsp:Transcript_7768/g.20541  ORF Transcript_7768/g.20541 Transcript_7768/m.20541 type:complete len:134 (+) Transcript_7768:248-649(+)|eukprot:CAMPEP_0185838856 /NCGR_PEP_ID=MMETSP1353-20130828/13680_1 /TAXON_ID=1077150 /ORGANISM="Erythrolobus australicus, Strain CCMP3124" /LENGTH=133 /DNA_ID=CAMNT_0028537953 /DNA_START=208 /DNA_END=609 /DNA_ORIENTATION=-
MSLLAIVSANDELVYETTLARVQLQGKQIVVAQLVLNASLDMVDEAMWTTKDRYLKVVDRFNDQLISAYVTAGNYRFLLLHDSRNEEGVQWFFLELHDLFVKIAMNPLYEHGTPIKSNVFHQRVLNLASKHLN